jgi:hypothetical protein
VDVFTRIVADALGVLEERGVHTRARDERAVVARETEVPCHRLEPVPREVARSEVVPPHRV